MAFLLEHDQLWQDYIDEYYEIVDCPEIHSLLNFFQADGVVLDHHVNNGMFLFI